MVKRGHPMRSVVEGLQNMGRNCRPMSMTSTEHGRPHGQIPHGIGRQSGGQVVTAPSWGTHDPDPMGRPLDSPTFDVFVKMSFWVWELYTR